MGNKQRRQERMMRIPTGPAQAGAMMQPLGLHVVERVSSQAVKLSDGSLQLEAVKFGTPEDVYEADFAWIERWRDIVRIRFGQGEGDGLDSRLTVRWSREAFVAHFWDNSKDFYGRLEKRAERREKLIDRHRDAEDPSKWATPPRRHQLTANFSVIAHAGNEACADFFHLPATAVAKWAQMKDGSDLVVAPRVRVTLTTDELFRLLKKSALVAEELRPLIADVEAL